MDATFRALADPRRRTILSSLRAGELSAGKVAAKFDVTRPAISQHLAVLRAAGLVLDRRVGTRRLYRLRPQGTAELRSWLEAFRDDGLVSLGGGDEDEPRGTNDRTG